MQPVFLELGQVLALNDVKLKADPEGLEALVRDVARGKAGKARIADSFRRLRASPS